MIKLINKNQIDRIYFILSILIPFYFGIYSALYAFSQPYIVQDDVRHHLVWMQSFKDVNLFKDDFIGSYYQSTFAPLGYNFFYRVASNIGLDVLTIAKILPILLGVVTSIYYFKFCSRFSPYKIIGFISVLIINENFWLNDDLISATPRAFLYPIFAGFLYYLSIEKYFFCIVFITLQSLFYPLFVLLEIGVLLLSLLRVNNSKILIKKDKLIWGFIGLIVTFIAFLPNIINPSEYGPTVNRFQMQSMLEFYPGGRTQYFSDNLFDFIFSGRSGINFPTYPYVIWLGFLMPLLVKNSLNKPFFLNPKKTILFHILIVSVVLYICAHFFAMKLYLPSRYIMYSLVFILSISAGISIFLITKFIVINLNNFWGKSVLKKTFLWASIFVIFYSLISPIFPQFFIKEQRWIIGKSPEIYKFLSNQPKDIVVASTSLEADNIPAFTLRSVWVGSQFAQPYHLGYYSKFRQRMLDLISAQYSQDFDKIREFIELSKTDYWLLDINAFSSTYFDLDDNKWLKQYEPIVNNIITDLRKGIVPALTQVVDQCSVVVNTSHKLIDAKCIKEFINNGAAGN